MLDKILEDIEIRLNELKALINDDDVQFPDGEGIYKDGVLHGRFNELIHVRDMIKSYEPLEKDCSDCSRRKFYMEGYKDGQQQETNKN